MTKLHNASTSVSMKTAVYFLSLCVAGWGLYREVQSSAPVTRLAVFLIAFWSILVVYWVQALVVALVASKKHIEQ